MSEAREDCVRVKRKNQTFFIHTSPSDTFAFVKGEIAQALGGDDEISPEKMRLFIETPKDAADDKDGDEDMGGKTAPKGPIPDEAKLSDHEVKNDAIVYVTFANDGGDWEEIEVDNA